MPAITDLSELLEIEGYGIRGRSIFVSAHAAISTKDEGPLIVLVATGGAGPQFVQNRNTVNTERPTVQVSIRHADAAVGFAFATTLWARLSSITNRYLGTTFYRRIRAIQSPFDLGIDSQGRSQTVFNLEMEKEP